MKSSTKSAHRSFGSKSTYVPFVPVSPINDKLTIWTGVFLCSGVDRNAGNLAGTRCFRGTCVPVATLVPLAPFLQGHQVVRADD